MSLPTYTLAITATLDSAAVQNQRVTVRNERTGNTKFSNTDSNGQTIIDAASITGGVVTGDILTTFSIYANYEGSRQHTVTAGGADITLTLTTVPASDTLRYLTVQDFYDEVGYESNDSQLIKAVDVVKVGSDIEAEIDDSLAKRFDNANTVTDEYHSMKDRYQSNFYLDKLPIQSITGFSINDANEESDANWRALTVTADTGDIEYDSDTGLVSIKNSSNYPEVGFRQIKVSYTHGYSSVPREIKRLVILMTLRHFMLTAIGRSLSSGREFTPTTNFLDREIDRIMARHKVWKMSNT